MIQSLSQNIIKFKSLFFITFQICQYRTTQLLNQNDADEINVVKCEPWNSVKITFDLPTEAAQRLSELAELARRGDDTTLRQLGILSLQVQGGQVNQSWIIQNYFSTKNFIL